MKPIKRVDATEEGAPGDGCSVDEHTSTEDGSELWWLEFDCAGDISRREQSILRGVGWPNEWIPWPMNAQIPPSAVASRRGGTVTLHGAFAAWCLELRGLTPAQWSVEAARVWAGCWRQSPTLVYRYEGGEWCACARVGDRWYRSTAGQRWVETPPSTGSAPISYEAAPDDAPTAVAVESSAFADWVCARWPEFIRTGDCELHGQVSPVSRVQEILHDEYVKWQGSQEYHARCALYDECDTQTIAVGGGCGGGCGGTQPVLTNVGGGGGGAPPKIKPSTRGEGENMNIKQTTQSVTPYLYAGAMRAGVTLGVDAVREQFLARVPSDTVATATEFLRTPAGDALLRLAMAGALTALPPEKRPSIYEDARQELLVSSVAAGVTAVREGVELLSSTVVARLSEEGAE